MDRAKILVDAEALARTLTHAGHDYWHVDRVRRMALRLAKEEGADPFVVEVAALLHDVWDHKFMDGDESIGPREARAFLEERGADTALADHVSEIIATLSFKGAKVPTPMRTIEGKCVQDADRLDALGAIGIARCFAYAGKTNKALYDPAQQPESHASFDAYKKNNSSGIMHFYEKLFLLKDRMSTETAKRIAASRHAFTEEYVRMFKNEWAGTD